MNLDESHEIERETLSMTDKRIFTNIWISTRLVFKYINDDKYDKFVYILLFFAGITRSIDSVSENNMGDNMPLIAVLAAGQG